ncbi:hypothetical protein H105_06221 [Trichophyton soudanense CBS 452.61]|uniref:Uncharacterized protein n=1 Tax=Trichophyton soudanense CBS 452.61 TaxID=1215331 RepID=A0A022XLC8_TRISD|nr:hypothetical protein H105_06221 [Trichophyton soudanense CBS 452.61]EZG03803.1 hypothetical protein H106_06045 [Trichophyton rubrum CBS 735.88]
MYLPYNNIKQHYHKFLIQVIEPRALWKYQLTCSILFSSPILFYFDTASFWSIPSPRFIWIALSSPTLAIPTVLSQQTSKTFTPSPPIRFPSSSTDFLDMEYMLSPTTPSFSVFVDRISHILHVPSWLPLISPYWLFGSRAKETTTLVCPLKVMAETVVAESRGSIRVICRAAVPAASSVSCGRCSTHSRE